MGNKKRAKQALCLLLAPVRNKRAASLVIVLVSFAVLMVVGVSLLSIVSYNHKNAADYHRKQQAEYTARGVMEAIVEAFDKPTTGNGKAILEKVEALGTGNTLEGAGSMADANMGEYKVELTLVKPEEIKAVVIATYQGMSYKVSAHFEKNTGGNTLDPFEFLFFNRVSTPTVFEPTGTDKATLKGNVYFRGSGEFKKLNITGKLLFTGSSTADNCQIVGDVISTQRLELRVGSTITGNEYYETDISGTAGTGNISGFLGFDDDVITNQRKWSSIKYDFPNAFTEINFDGLTYSHPSIYMINGAPISSGTHTIGSREATVSGNTVEFDDGDKIDMTTHIYTAVNGETLSFAVPQNVASGVASCFGPPDMSKITGSTSISGGTISAGVYKTSGSSINSQLTLDTSGGDIHIYVQSDITANANIVVAGDGNAYLHMMGKSFTANGNSVIGETPHHSDRIQLFIEGEGTSLTMNASSRFRGFAYMPTGAYNEGISSTSGIKKVEGSITADSFAFGGGNTYEYVKFLNEPVFKSEIKNNTDPSKPYFVYPPTSGSSGDNWTLIGYY